MIDNNLFRDLLRYGTIKRDCDLQDKWGRFIRVCIYELDDKTYLIVMCNGEVLKCEEIK